MQIVLVMFRSDGQRRSFSIHKETTVLGRREDCDVRIPLGEISRKHCRVIRDDEAGELRVEDLGSSNGTYVNGHRVQRATLAAGDTLQVGPVAFVIQLDGVPADEELTPHTRESAAASASSASAVPASSADRASISDGADAGSGIDRTIADEGQTIATPPVNGAAAGEFDPSTILGGPDDSGANESLDSAVAHDIAADLERANRSR